jgi:hypothetical protein
MLLTYFTFFATVSMDSKSASNSAFIKTNIELLCIDITEQITSYAEKTISVMFKRPFSPKV